MIINHNGTLLDFVHPQNAALGRVENGRREQGTVNTAIGDGKCAAGEIVEADFAFFGFDRVVVNGGFNLGKAEVLGVANDGNHQAFFRAHGHPDVAIIVVDNFVALDLRVDFRYETQRLNTCFHEK